MNSTTSESSYVKDRVNTLLMIKCLYLKFGNTNEHYLTVRDIFYLGLIFFFLLSPLL